MVPNKFAFNLRESPILRVRGFAAAPGRVEPAHRSLPSLLRAEQRKGRLSQRSLAVVLIATTAGSGSTRSGCERAESRCVFAASVTTGILLFYAAPRRMNASAAPGIEHKRGSLAPHWHRTGRARIFGDLENGLMETTHGDDTACRTQAGGTHGNSFCLC